MDVQDLILPDTPDYIQKMYLAYEQEAKERVFSLIEEEYVVVDTETTGLDLKTCELIEIAAARIRGNEVLDRFHTYVKPSDSIPDFIVELTGISDEDVENAPSSEDALAAFRAFVNKSPIIAHNVGFDRKFLNGAKGGGNLTDVWIDSLALSRIALPRLSSHSLSNLSQAFHCAPVTHRAMDDVDALVGVWRVILVGLSHLPPGVVYKMAHMHKDINWPYRHIFNMIEPDEPSDNFSLKKIRRLLKINYKDRKGNAFNKLGDLKSPTVEDIEKAFLPDGFVDSMYDNYCYREDQVRMSQEARAAFAESTIRCIEAGTGVGKSVAYLLPMVMYAKLNHVCMGVATKTNALADQLMTHELPLLNSVFSDGVAYSIVKGYTHYPCMQQLEKAMRGFDKSITHVHGKSKHTVETDVLNAIATTLAYSCQSPVGDLDSSGIRWNNVPRDLLTTVSTECSKSRCPFFNSGCFVYEAREKAHHSDIVVTNHSLLLNNIEVDNALLPNVNHWVIDEAHSFENEARKQWSLSLDTASIRRSCYELNNYLKSKGGIVKEEQDKKENDIYANIIGEESLGMCLEEKWCRKGMNYAKELIQHIDKISEALNKLVSAFDTNSSYDNNELWINKEVRNTPYWENVTSELSDTHIFVNDFILYLNKFQEFLTTAEVDDRTGKTQTKPKDLNLMRAISAFSEIDALINKAMNPEQDDMMITVEHSSANNKKEYLIRAQYINIDQVIVEKFLDQMLSVIFTSATIEVSESFDYFNRQTGLSLIDSDRYKNLKLESSFNYRENMSLYLVKDLPEQSDGSYIEQMADAIYDIHLKSNGSVLTLFTNKRDMEAIYDLVLPRLEKIGLDLYKQDASHPAHVVKNKFINNKSSSLFALKSFWEGIDAQGDTLRTVIITKLPFPNPSDPLYQERSLRERDAWRKYYIPEAVIAMKQAVGRLLRNESDKGSVYILDSRMETKNYSHAFKKSMPVEANVISKQDINNI